MPSPQNCFSGGDPAWDDHHTALATQAAFAQFVVLVGGCSEQNSLFWGLPARVHFTPNVPHDVDNRR